MIVSGLILVVSGLSAVRQNPLLYEYFFGPHGLIAVLGETPGTVAAFTEAILAKPFMYNIVVFVVAILAGLIVYILLQGINRLLAGVLGGLVEVQEADAKSKKLIEAEVSARFGVRILALAGWFLYWIFFIKILLPFCLLSAYINANELFTWQGWLHGLLAFIVLTAGLHLHVIFMRFVLLRPRLFGIRDAIIVEDDK